MNVKGGFISDPLRLGENYYTRDHDINSFVLLCVTMQIKCDSDTKTIVIMSPVINETHIYAVSSLKSLKSYCHFWSMSQGVLE